MTNDVPDILLDLGVESKAARHLRAYFRPAKSGSIPKYSGSRFETFPDGAAGLESPNDITAEVLLAVQCRGVRFTGDQALWILDVKRGEITRLLKQFPIGTVPHHLWDEDQVDIETNRGEGFEGMSSATQLWQTLSRLPVSHQGFDEAGEKRHGVGPTRTSKLMARKRPDLFPIFDSRVKKMLGARNSSHWYERYRDLMLTEQGGVALYRRLGELTQNLKSDDGSGVPVNLTVLRACDVILWMEQRESTHYTREMAG